MDFFRYLQFSPGFFRDLQVFFQVNPGFCIEPPTSLPWRRSVPWTTVAPAIRAIHLGRCVGPPNVWREMPWPCWITWDGPLGTESFQCQGTGNWELLGFYVLCILCIITYVYTYTHIYYIVLYIYICVCDVCVLDMICTKDMYIFIYGWPSICGISCFFKNVPGSFQGEGAHHWNQHGWHDRAGELENPPVLRWENPDFPIPKWLVLGFKKANHVWCFRRINAYKCDKWTHGVMVRPPFFVVKIWLMGVSGQNRDDLTMFLDIPGERESVTLIYHDIPKHLYHLHIQTYIKNHYSSISSMFYQSTVNM